jgi:uncharacterized protein DUF2877
MMRAPGRRLYATAVGASAELLLDERRVGSVQSVFSRALNVQVGDGMICVVRRDVGRSPMNVVLDIGEGASLTELGVRPGAGIWREGRTLVLGGGVLTVQLPVEADLPPRLIRRLRDLRRTAANLARLREDILIHGNLAGLGGVLLLPPRVPKGVSPQLSQAARAASGPLLELVQALASGRLDLVAASARELIGLGPGLTPAADDVLVGLMQALLVTWRALGRDDGFAEKANAHIYSQVDGRTTRLSREFLMHASRGLGSEHSDSLLERVLFGTPQGVESAAQRLFEVGATSGTDIALGILLGVTVGLEAGRRTMP